LDRVEVMWGSSSSPLVIGDLGFFDGWGGMRSWMRQDIDSRTNSEATGLKLILFDDRNCSWPKSMRRGGEFCVRGHWNIGYNDMARALQSEIVGRFNRR